MGWYIYLHGVVFALRSTTTVVAVDHALTPSVVPLLPVSLSRWRQVLPVTYSSLIQSSAGKALKAFKDHPDAGVRKQAKAVISHWKTSLVVRKKRERRECDTCTFTP